MDYHDSSASPTCGHRNAEHQGVAAGAEIRAAKQSDGVALIQEALVAIAYSLPVAGIYDTFGNEPTTTVSQFKGAGPQPNRSVVGVGTSNRLDFVQMIVINGDGSQPHVVAKFGRPKLAIYAPQRGVWSPDARSLAVNRFDSIWIISAKTGVRRARIRGDFWTVWDWQVLPGRRGVRFTG